MSLILPDRVRINMERERVVTDHLTASVRLTAVLRDIDPRLDVVWADERAPARYDLVPGRWHVRRRNDPPAADTYLPLTTPDGGYMDPHGGVEEWLRGRDLQNPRVVEWMEQDARRKDRERERAKKRFWESKRDEFAVNLKALGNPSVLVNTDLRWGNKHKNRRH